MKKVIYSLLVMLTIGIVSCSQTKNNNNTPKVTTKEALQSCITLFELLQQPRQQLQEKEAIGNQLQLILSNFKAAKETETDLNIQEVVSSFVNYLEASKKADQALHEAYQKADQARHEAYQKKNAKTKRKLQ